MIQKLDQILTLFSLIETEFTGPEIAARIQRPKSSVYRLLGTLTDVGYLDQDGDTGRYRLGIRLAALGDIARHSTSLQRLARPWLQELTDATGELADLTVLAGSRLITVEVVESLHPISVPGLLGGQPPVHATAAGKVFLAWRSESERGRLLTMPLERFTPHTITDPARFELDLGLTRKHGFAQVRGEWFPDLASVGAPVRNHRGEVIAAVALGVPESRCTRAKIAAMGRAAIHAAQQLSRQLGYSERPTASMSRSGRNGAV
jgi:DNA-binding IclR family transcriptional regulator